jgi:hypothetical protein
MVHLNVEVGSIVMSPPAAPTLSSRFSCFIRYKVKGIEIIHIPEREANQSDYQVRPSAGKAATKDLRRI